MGCDIHVFVEGFVKGKWVSLYPPKGDGSWSDWAKYTDLISPVEVLSKAHDPEEKEVEEGPAPFWYFGRDYDAFGYLAGVRGDAEAFDEPRDVPEDMSVGVCKKYWLRIVETETEEAYGTVIRERAESWVNRENGERYCTLHGIEYVTHPDWHTASYYTLSELVHYLKERQDAAPRIGELRDAIKKVMKEEGLTKHTIRVVFWFDN